MKKFLTASLLALFCVPAFADTASPTQSLTGDTKLSCEALLCLPSPTHPAECRKAIRKYFSIWATKPHKRIAKRKAFLKLCPTGGSADKLIEDILNNRAYEYDCTGEAVSDVISEFRKEQQERNQSRNRSDKSVTYDLSAVADMAKSTTEFCAKKGIYLKVIDGQLVATQKTGSGMHTRYCTADGKCVGNNNDKGWQGLLFDKNN